MSVIVYSTPTCPYCHMVKQFLDGKGIEYEYVDVSADPARANEMIEKSGQMGVPVTDIDGTIIVGFDKASIEAALGPVGQGPAAQCQAAQDAGAPGEGGQGSQEAAEGQEEVPEEVSEETQGEESQAQTESKSQKKEGHNEDNS